MIIPWGTIINVIAVIIGSILGLAIKGSLKDKYKLIVFQSLGLLTIVIGVSMALQMKNPLIIIFSVIIGGLIGEFINLDMLFEKLAEKIKKLFKFKEQKFVDGLITAFLLFCVGSMTILGSIQEGTSGNKDLLITKSVLDGFSSIALASTFGIGVLFSIVPMFVFQGGMTILASQLGNLFSTDLISYISAIGGILIFAIGINLLELKKIKVVNLLPSILVVVLIFLTLTKLGISF